MKIKLSAKISVFVTILVILASGIIGIYSINKSSDVIMNLANEELEEVAKDGSELVNSQLNRDLDVLTEISIKVNSMNWEDIKSYLASDMQRLNYLDMGIVYPDGSTQYLLGESKENLIDKEYIQNSFKGEKTFSDIEILKDANTPIITEAVPIKNNNTIVGVLVAKKDVGFLSELVDTLGIGERGYAFILASDSTIIAHPTRDLVTSQGNPLDDIQTDGNLKEFGLSLQKLGLRNKGFANYSFEGEERLTAMHPIDGTDWTLGVGNYEIDYLAPANTLRNTIFIILAAVIILSIILSYILGKIIAKPVIKIKHLIDEMSKGHLKERLNIKTRDEIGDMAETLNLYMDNLQNYVVKPLDEISRGDLSSEILIVDEKDEIGPALKRTSDSIKALSTEANSLISSAVDGKLDERADDEKFTGEFKKIILGFNKTLDAVLDPIDEAASVLEEMQKGNLNAKVVSDYNGDHAKIKNSLNKTIYTIKTYINDITDVTKEMALGNMSVSIDREYIGDFKEIKTSLNETIANIRDYIEDISDVTEKIADGVLNVSIDKDYKGDFSSIKNSLNLIIDKLNESFSEITSAAEQVSSGASQISDGAQELSQGSTEQASSIEQVTASITQIAAQTKENASNAKEANKVASNMKSNATIGNQSMDNMIKSMKDINDSSKNIQNIIKVIDDIAFQTNLLALNAAVEAARAGQQGKGFAVVAEEVRNLAGRSAEAARETTSLIESSINDVKKGTNIANETATALESVLKEIDKTSELVSQIASASNEQATAVAQIDEGVIQVSEVVQNNSATAEQAAASSEELSGQAEMLKEMVSQFKLKESVYASISVNKISSSQVEQPSNIDDSNPSIDLDNDDFGKY